MRIRRWFGVMLAAGPGGGVLLLGHVAEPRDAIADVGR
jgi:hypothetical protein